MSPVAGLLLVVAGLVLLPMIVSVEVRLRRRRRMASWRLEAERKAREASRPFGNVRVGIDLFEVGSQLARDERDAALRERGEAA